MTRQLSHRFVFFLTGLVLVLGLAALANRFSYAASSNATVPPTCEANGTIPCPTPTPVTPTPDPCLNNTPPQANDDQAVSPEDSSLNIAVLENDFDAEANIAEIVTVSTPLYGQAAISGNVILYTPQNRRSGYVDTFTYTVRDSCNATSNSATVTVTVTADNDAPSINGSGAAAALETVPFTYTVSGSDPDVDDAIRFSIIAGQQAWFSPLLTTTNSATLTGTPPQDTAGIYTITLQVQDIAGSTATHLLNLSVADQNQPPIAVDDTFTVAEDSTNLLNVLLNDSDPDANQTIGLAGVGQAANGTTTQGSNSIQYAPAPNFFGTDVFTYTIQDNFGATDVATVTVTVTPVNDPPTIDSISSFAIDEDAGPQVLALTGIGSGAANENDTLSISVSSGNPALINPTVVYTSPNTTGQMLYTPAANASGSATILINVDDGGSSTSRSFVITVRPINDAPVAVDDTKTMNANSAATIFVLGNDTDVENDPLTIVAVGTPISGTVSFTGDSLVYTPTAGFVGTDSFTYTVSDGDKSATATVTVTVSAVFTNSPPVAVNDSASTPEETVVTVNVLSNDSDFDNDAIAVVGVTGAQHGTVRFTSSSIIYTPTLNFNGTDVLTYTISDGSDTAVATLTISVTPVNDPPTIDAVQPFAIDEDAGTQTVSLTGITSGAPNENDTLSVSALSLNPTLIPNPVVVSYTSTNSSGQLTFTSIPNAHGFATIRVTVSDGNRQAVISFGVTVRPVNDSPVAVADSATTTEDTPVSIFVLSNDTDIDSLLLVVAGLVQPVNGQVSVDAGQRMVYTPRADFNGSDVFTYTVSDGNSSASTLVTVNVTPVNDAPDAVNDSAVVDEDSSVTIPVLSNDTDIEGNSLTIVGVSAAAHGSAQATEVSARLNHGTVRVAADGNAVIYTPDANFAGSDSFSYTIDDGNGGSDIATVNLVVNQINDEPVAKDDAADTAAGTAVTIDLLANDSDLEGDTLSVTGVFTPTSGSVLNNNNGTVTYTPAAGFTGLATFIYNVSDGTTESTATVSVVVAGVSGIVTAVDDTVVSEEDRVLTIPVLSNDSTTLGTLRLIRVGTPLSGSAVISGTNIVYTPKPNVNGVDHFSYTVSNGGVGVGSANVTITLAPVNDPPTAVADNAETDEEMAVDIAVLTNDSDPDTGDTLRIASIAQGKNGSVTLNNDGSLRYRPNRGFVGTDTFSYAVADAGNLTNSVRVTVLVNNVNDSPDAINDASSTDENIKVNVAVLSNDSDPDNDPLTIIAVSRANNGATAIVNGEVFYTPTIGYFGDDRFTYRISDGEKLDTATVRLTVVNQPDPPRGVSDAEIIPAGQDSKDIDLLGNDYDPDGNDIEVESVGDPQNGRVEEGDTQLRAATATNVRYFPNTGFQGTDSFTYTVRSATGEHDTETVTVIVNPTAGAVVADAETASTNEDVPVTVDVLIGDTGSGLQVLGLTKPANGRAVVNGDNSVTYTPNRDFNGTDVFTYTVGDGNLGAAQASVTITVNAVNDIPRAEDDNFTFNEDEIATVDIAAGVLKNDSDPDMGDILTVQGIASQPAHGALTLKLDGSFVYTPAVDYNGTDSFAYTVQDNHGGDNEAVVILTILPTNDAPEPATDMVVVDEDSSVLIDVVSNDFDADGDVLAIGSFTQPAHGATSASGSSAIHYQPTANFSGSDIFTYTVTDGSGSNNNAQVRLTVRPVNDAPVLTHPDGQVNSVGASVVLALAATDVDSNLLTYAATGLPAGLQLNPLAGVISGKPDEGSAGTYNVTVEVSDGALTDTASFAWVITDGVAEPYLLYLPSVMNQSQQQINLYLPLLSKGVTSAYSQSSENGGNNN